MKKLIFLLLALLVSTSCGRRYIMNRPDMHLAPSLSLENLPKTVTAVTYAVNPVLDLSEGGDGRFSWSAVLQDGTGQETKLLALNLKSFGVDNRFIIIIPKHIKLAGCRLAVFDHGGKRIYNHRGEVRLLDGMSKKVDFKEHSDFLPELNSSLGFVKELETDSEEFLAIVQLYADFRIRDLEMSRDYIYKKYGANLTSEQLDRLAREDSIVRGFVDWLGRDWKLFLTIPFVGFGGSALAAGAVKVLTLPSIWGDRIDLPGYMEHQLDAEETARMILRGLREFSPQKIE